MHRLKIIFRVVVVLVFGAFFHYTLPQHDVVQVTSTEIIRTDLGMYNRHFFAQADSGGANTLSRDLRLINTNKKDTWLFGFVPRDSTGVMVYRNEDTGWNWPPYFKFDSADLQAEASNLARGDSWAVITHYGWRVRWASIYPNAVGLRVVEGPDVRIIPWFNLFFFGFLMIAIAFIRAMWRQFRERTVDPILDSAGHHVDEVQADVAETKSRFTSWLGRLRGKQ